MKKIALNFMRLLSLTVILALIAPVLANAQGKANFAGSWTMNAAKSTQPPAGGQGGGQGGGGGMRMGGGDFTATQEANLLTRTRTGQDGTATSTKYSLDGKETVVTTQRGDSKVTATWSADGKTLTVVTKSQGQNGERVSTEAWTLTDPKTLSVTSTRNGQDGTPVKTTMVYDKK
ncbi:MAG TPA: hypothetical protein VIK07_09425 [Bacteroidales bacterium]